MRPSGDHVQVAETGQPLQLQWLGQRFSGAICWGITYLVGGNWNMTFIFHSVGNFIIPIDKYFSEGFKPPTRYPWFKLLWGTIQIIQLPGFWHVLTHEQLSPTLAIVSAERVKGWTFWLFSLPYTPLTEFIQIYQISFYHADMIYTYMSWPKVWVCLENLGETPRFATNLVFELCFLGGNPPCL